MGYRKTYPFAVTWDGDTFEACALLLLFLAGPETRAIFGQHEFEVAGAG